jgi:very-short-patch-repair endonuclease
LRGRLGARQVRELQRVCRTGAASAAEWRLHRLLAAAGIDGWQAGARVVDLAGEAHVVDVLFAIERLVVEVDGWRAHRGVEAFRADRRRQNTLVTAGYTVLRFTWDDLTRRPDAVAGEIRVTLARLQATTPLQP